PEALFSYPRRIPIHSERFPEHVGDLPDRDSLLHRRENRRHHVLTARAGFAHAQRRLAGFSGIALSLPGPNAIRLRAFDLRIDLQDRNRPLLRHLILVHSDHDFVAAVEGPLETIRRLADFLLRKALFDRFDDAAHGVDALDVCPSLTLELARQ